MRFFKKKKNNTLTFVYTPFPVFSNIKEVKKSFSYSLYKKEKIGTAIPFKNEYFRFIIILQAVSCKRFPPCKTIIMLPC